MRPTNREDGAGAIDDAARARLEADGWRFGDYGDFLELSPEERAEVERRSEAAERLREVRSMLAAKVKTLREGLGITQEALAASLQSSQSHVAKVEAGAEGVSLDLMFRSFFAVGGRLDDLTTVAKPRRKAKVVTRAKG